MTGLLALIAGLAISVGGAGMFLVLAGAEPAVVRRATVIAVAKDGFAPEATAPPAPAPTEAENGPIVAVALASAALFGDDPVERLDTRFEGGLEFFENPTAPGFIVHYPRFGIPGRPGANTILAAHVNYLGFGPGPFASVATARIGDMLTIAMADGTLYVFSVQSIDVIPLSMIDMDAIVFPALPSSRERATLISCGGTCIPNGTGCDYDSRVVVVAERYLD